MELYDDFHTVKRSVEKDGGGITSPLQIEVPPNTLVIELSEPGHLCYFTRVKETLDPLFKDRARLLSYLSGIPPVTDDLPIQQEILKALSVCHIYMPGTVICNRILTLGGGMTEMATGALSSERTSLYRTMGFFRFDSARRGGEPVQILDDLRTRLMTQSYGRLNKRGRGTDLVGSYISYWHMLYTNLPIPPEGEFRIVVFPSCGRVIDSDEISEDDAISLIRGVQATAKQYWAQLISGRNLTKMSDMVNESLEKMGFVGGKMRTNYVEKNGEYDKRMNAYKTQMTAYKTQMNAYKEQMRVGAGGGGSKWSCSQCMAENPDTLNSCKECFAPRSLRGGRRYRRTRRALKKHNKNKTKRHRRA